jgi:hypothetical protein
MTQDMSAQLRVATKGRVLAGAVILLGFVGGCGGGAKMAVTSSSGGLPSIVSAQQLARYPINSPQRATMTIIRFAQLDDEFAVVAEYQPKVRAVLGDTTIAAAYDLQRSDLIDITPTILGVQSTPQGDVLTLEETPRTGAPTLDTFVFRQVHGVWLVAYDSLLERALAYYTQTQIDPATSAAPSHRALLAGEAEASLYRNVFLAPPAASARPKPSTASRPKSSASTSAKSSTPTTASSSTR